MASRFGRNIRCEKRFQTDFLKRAMMVERKRASSGASVIATGYALLDEGQWVVGLAIAKIAVNDGRTSSLSQSHR